MRSHAVQDIADIFDHGASLGADIESDYPQGICFGAGDAVVGAARAGARDKKKVARTLDVRKLSARRGFAFDDFAFCVAQSLTQMLFNSE